MGRDGEQEYVPCSFIPFPVSWEIWLKRKEAAMEESGKDMELEEPQSRVEKILAKAIQKYTDDLEDPQSRIEKLLVELSSYIEQLAQGSGGGVTPDWSVEDEGEAGFIKNKPSVSAGKGSDAVVEGSATKATGEDSHAEGYSCTASGNYTHAEGFWSKATTIAAHAEGFSNTASGNDSHAEGYSTTAGGTASHAEGSNAAADGAASHAEGYYTVANGCYQHVCGKYNVGDASGTQGVYAEIVGNGTGDSARSNARTLDWNGNEVLAGKLTMGASPVRDMDAATKKYVDDLIAGLQAKIDALTPAGSCQESIYEI